MTLEESNKQALAAAQAGDLETLADALNSRRQAIAELQRQAPSVELAARMRDALQVGDVIADALFRWKQRLGAESARLARIADTVTVGCGVERSKRLWGGQPAREAGLDQQRAPCRIFHTDS